VSSSAAYFLPTPYGGAATAGSEAVSISKPRRWLDASTRDFLVELGDYKQDAGFTSKVVLALGTKRGSAQAYPGFGSQLHLVKHADERGRRLAESYALLAVQHLRDEVRDLKATAELDARWPGLIFLTVSGRRGTITVYAKYTARV
jgi:hypothetical protein